MRITAEQKATTRQRILDVAAKLFRSRGYDATTTRDIAAAAKIAAGTLFNYFPTKEAIVSSLVDAALVRADGVPKAITADSLEEELFACIAAELRQLKPHRKYISALLESSLSPLVALDYEGTGEALRTRHLEMVDGMAAAAAWANYLRSRFSCIGRCTPACSPVGLPTIHLSKKTLSHCSTSRWRCTQAGCGPSPIRQGSPPCRQTSHS